VDIDPREDDTIVSVRDFRLSECSLSFGNARDCPSIIDLIAESSSSAALDDMSR
jgi:hypothetical protein